jgi:hypothetical protein
VDAPRPAMWWPDPDGEPEFANDIDEPAPAKERIGGKPAPLRKMNRSAK